MSVTVEVESKLDLVYTPISFFHLRRKLGFLWPPGDATHLSMLHSLSIDTNAGQCFILEPEKGSQSQGPVTQTPE